jgi:transposase
MKEDNRKQTAKSRREAKKVEQLRTAQEGLASCEANSLVIGIDLGDTNSAWCARRRSDQQVMVEAVVKTSVTGMHEAFGQLPRQRIVMETGTHSRWVAQLLELCGHEVIVANARKLKLIAENNQKSDKVDARLLSQMGCLNVEWLHPVYRRSQQTHSDLTVLRAREALVEMRTGLVNCIRGTVKSFGCRLKTCTPENFVEVVKDQIPESLKPALSGLLSTVDHVNEQIYGYDCQIRHLCETRYREATGRLLQVRGVGPVTSLSFVLTIEDENRFDRSREVGPYLGLIPRKRQSGNSDPHLGITKAGDEMVRRLLVNCAHYMLGVHGGDSDLRRWGLGIVRAAQSRGKPGARKLAAAAVARKLAVLLHRLWVTGARYEPLRNSNGCASQAAA